MKSAKPKITKEQFLHSELTGKIIGCAMKVHSALGCGYPEVIYQRALTYEMNKQRIQFAREIEIPIYYNGFNVGIRRVDFIVDNKVVLELKAVGEMDNGNFNQVINYLEAYEKEIGLLVNFGAESLQFKRFINSQKKRTSHQRKS